MTDVLNTDDTMTETAPTFADLGLSPALLQALVRLEYTTPTPIQTRTIPSLLSGRDVLGQAQTGTGKTAAFALPMLQLLDMSKTCVQALVLVPTRELALQVAEAVHGYSADMGAVGVLPIYGGDPIHRQLSRLAGTVRVVVGTPGRVLDHLSRGTLRLDGVRMAVLDEADEMLRMGFVDDVDTILSKMPSARQTALFSATMPDEIARIAQRHLRQPDNIAVAGQTRTVSTVDQCYMIVEPQYRVEALARLLTVQDIDAALVFARTRAGCATLAEMLEARGFASEAMHGDMAQSARESVIRRLKNGQLRVVVATDVAARGLDVEQINLVVNVEMPNDPSVYVHRIGRTGRAGRAGRSVLFVTPREDRRLRDLERFIGQKMTLLPAPTLRDVQAARTARFAGEVQKIMEEADLTPFRPVVTDLVSAERSLEDVAAALARMAWGDKPLPVVQGAEPVIAAPPPMAPRPPQDARPPQDQRPRQDARPPQDFRPQQDFRQPQQDFRQPPQDFRQPPQDFRQPPQDFRQPPQDFRQPPQDFRQPLPDFRQPPADFRQPPQDFRQAQADFRPPQDQRPAQDQRPGTAPPRGDTVRLSLGVGRRNGVLPKDIVGAIANEAGVPGQAIGGIDIRDNFSLVELPVSFVPQIMDRMRRAMICGRYLNIRVMSESEALQFAPPPVRQHPARPAARPHAAPVRMAPPEIAVLASIETKGLPEVEARSPIEVQAAKPKRVRTPAALAKAAEKSAAKAASKLLVEQGDAPPKRKAAKVLGEAL